MNWDRVERLLGAAEFAYLRQKKVAIIGLGSGGGFVAQGLAMSGVARFLLIDIGTLQAHNVVRHVGDNRDVGRPKTEVVRDLILARNPQAEVVALQGRIEDHAEQLDGVDLVVCAVDNEGAKYFINQLCLQKGLIALYAGVYERGEGGDVALIYPDTGPCYACWAANLRQGYLRAMPDGSGELDYGLINEHGSLSAEPALWLHVVRVAATQADMVLNTLLRHSPAHRPLPANTVILANHAIEIFEGQVTPPYSAEWVKIERDPNCLVCGGRGTASQQAALSLDDISGGLIFIEDEESSLEIEDDDNSAEDNRNQIHSTEEGER